MQIDLICGIPEKLAESASMDDLTETVLRIDAWDDRQAQVLDYVYRQRLIRLITSAKRGNAASNELSAFARHLDKTTHPVRIKRLDGLDKPYKERWTAYLDIVESRLAALESDVPDHVMNLKNVREILTLVFEQESVSRKTIKDRFNLQPANLTRILNMMEASDLIVCQKVGREIRVSAGPNSHAYEPEASPEHPDFRRWGACFRQQTAA